MRLEFAETAELAGDDVADDAALQNYMIRHNLLSAEGATMAEQQVSTLGQQVGFARELDEIVGLLRG